MSHRSICPSAFDVARVISLDEVEHPALGSSDVRLRILAVSAEHNVDHAALADTLNIAEARGGKIYPGNSAVGEVLAVGDRVERFAPGDVVIMLALERSPELYERLSNLPTPPL